MAEAEPAARRGLRERAAGLPPVLRGLLWSGASGLLFCMLNALLRGLTQQLDPMQTQFLRYVFGFLVMLPLILRHGGAAYWPQQMGGQFLRGATHTLGLVLWFLALPHIPLADTTAIGFTGPLFIMMGAWLFLKEPMRWERWLATALGFAGVMIVVGPKLSGSGGWHHLLMLASAPVFAASFLLTKALTRTESAGVIVVWQAISVSLFSLPAALWAWQWPGAAQWFAFLVCGLLGSGGHYCLTRSFLIADISSTQSVKFLDLVWSAALGWIVFSDLPTQTTLLGGAVISAATLWVARREQRSRTSG
ncbi:EamA family transporter [Rubrivivax sp. A210]|uniref:DMT family transporter n=1 Tax=Rubrivivax sp. A210 TaxID=2772301 RepID=UPI001917B80D|nr:DMT family transporter [Rubrivivax sp. A210]CAD5373324.1 EamA family transporter [Rubrivivax sp. A210]